MSIALALLVTGLALSQSKPDLIDGDSLLVDCLADESCGDYITGILGENMAEFGFALQFDPIATSALAGRGVGVVTEVHIDTVVLGEGNDATKMLLIPPIIPRIAVGYQLGSFTYDNPYPQLSVGAFVLPPITILGDGVIFSTGGHVGASQPVVEHLVWAGVELDASWSHVGAPLVGTWAQLQHLAPLEPYLVEGATDCANIGPGCLDSFNQSAFTLRGGMSLEPLAGAFFYGRLAAAVLRQRLFVVYDRTTWAVGGVQPQLQFGGGFRAGDKYQAAMGMSIANKPAHLSTNDARLMAKVVTTFSYRFGHARYWESH
jgi:CBS domain-containing protein